MSLFLKKKVDDNIKPTSLGSIAPHKVNVLRGQQWVISPQNRAVALIPYSPPPLSLSLSLSLSLFTPLGNVSNNACVKRSSRRIVLPFEEPTRCAVARGEQLEEK